MEIHLVVVVKLNYLFLHLHKHCIHFHIFMPNLSTCVNQAYKPDLEKVTKNLKGKS